MASTNTNGRNTTSTTNNNNNNSNNNSNNYNNNNALSPTHLKHPYAPSRYLHSIGEIIFLDRDEGLDERIIIDPQWFCSTVIGKLSEPTRWVSHSSLRISQEGLISTGKLLQKLELHRLTKEGAELALAALEKLRLCDKVHEPANHYIVPVLLRGENGVNVKDWGDSKEFKIVCGRRFICESKIDALSAGFFPKLQITLPKMRGCVAARLGQGAIRLIAKSCDFLIIIAPDMQSKFFW